MQGAYAVEITFKDLSKEKQEEIMKITNGEPLKNPNKILARITITEGFDYYRKH